MNYPGPSGMTIATADTEASAARRTSLLYAVKRVELGVRWHLDELLKPSGITAVQYTALTVLEQHDGLPAAQLARRSFVTAQSTADLVPARRRCTSRSWSSAAWWATSRNRRSISSEPR